MSKKQDPNKCNVCQCRRGEMVRFSNVCRASWALTTATGPHIHEDYAPGERVILTGGKCQRCNEPETSNQSGKPGK